MDDCTLASKPLSAYSICLCCLCRLIGEIPDLTILSQQNLVAPLFSAPHWVIATGPNMEWAVISGGRPTKKTETGCIPDGEMNKGLWLYARKPIDSDSTDVMLAKLTSLGYDTSSLLPGQQEGCIY
jgi:lipocalin